MDDTSVVRIHRGQGDGFAPAPDFLGGVNRLLAEILVIFIAVVIVMVRPSTVTASPWTSVASVSASAVVPSVFTPFPALGE